MRTLIGCLGFLSAAGRFRFAWAFPLDIRDHRPQPRSPPTAIVDSDFSADHFRHAMMPIRQHAALAARQARAALARPAAAAVGSTSAVRFASTESHGDHHHDHHHHDHHAPVDEPMGSAFFIALGAIPFSFALYTLSKPGKDGEKPALTAYLDKWSSLTAEWERRNTFHTAAINQASTDKNLFYGVPRNTHVELRNPEIFMSGSPYNVPAGHNINLDKVVEHYRQEHHKEVARQAQAAAAKAQQ